MRKITCVIIISLSVVFAKCDKDVTGIPVKQFRNYTLRQDLPLHERVAPAPKVVMDFWMEADGRKDYTAYMPDSREMAVVRNGLDLLPPLNKKVLRERLIGIYFINNFCVYIY